MKRNLRRKVTVGERRSRSLLVAFLCFVLGLGNVLAQSGTSSVSGVVVDPQGRAVSGATVKLTNAQKNFSRVQTTTENGAYRFTSIPPETYQLEATASGFKKGVVSEVRASVDKPSNIDIQLEVGNIAESATVTAASGDVLVNKQDASLGNNFVSQQITQLPLESRNVVSLLSLQPGVTRDGYVTGSRADQANVTLDGVDVNEQQSGLDPLTGQAFASVLRVTPDSIEEFRVTTSNPNASQGRSSGAQVSLITKSGTNDFRGSVYWSHRNTVTSANDFFNNRTVDPETGKSTPRPKLLRNLFGVAIGGPIVKERTFFFYNYEGRRDASESSVVRVVPTATLGNGSVRFVNSGGGITTLTSSDINRLFPAVGANPAAIAVLGDAARKYPVNDFTTGDSKQDRLLNTGGFRFNAKTPLRWNTHTVRLDHNLTADGKHILFVRGNYQQDTIGGTPQFPDTPTTDTWSHPVGLAAGHTWTINNRLVNSFRYGLTREAFTIGGDSTQNAISFRDVFSPLKFARELSRVTPVHNFSDDLSYLKNSHSVQVGGNVRIISNTRGSFAKSFDNAIANPTFYAGSGNVLLTPISGIAPGFERPVRDAVTAVIGRFSQYSANFNFGADGSVLPAGAVVSRKFKTQEYDTYAQDVWKVSQTLTLTYGLRYSLSRPVYEANGLEVKPTVSLGGFFDKRVRGALAGTPVNDLITVDKSGPKNGRPGYYDWDKNNLQPRVALAWSPNFTKGFLGKLFGSQGASVFRGGFAITNDHIGNQLAVTFDLNNQLGFSSTSMISANTFNVTSRPAPRFTGFGQAVRVLPGITVPGTLTFPQQKPADEQQRIESSLDDTIVSPVNYSWNLSFGRQLPGGVFVEASYIGRKARNLLATRDIMQLNNLVDPASKTSWYQAAGVLADLRDKNTPVGSVPAIPYFNNLFPANLGAQFADAFEDPTFTSLTPGQAVYYLVARDGYNILDWTTIQLILDDFSRVGPNIFFHPQYGALSAFSTIARSDYNAGTLSIRKRLRDSLSLDFNYTLSKSMDDASGLQNSGTFGAAFILNPLDLNQSFAESDFDVRHIINANGIWKFPVGKGRKFLSGLPGFGDAILGGWELGGIYRWNSGEVAGAPFDSSGWATNWNLTSSGVRLKNIKASPTRGGKNEPNLFSDPTAAYQSFRNARAGEAGDRNTFRFPSFFTLDLNLSKSFTMPWSEGHKLQFRWEVFNVTNTQRLTNLDGFALDFDPNLGEPASSFGRLTAIQGTPRVMQFGLRYTF
ncbi:MAG TPA: carboxypeptidase-like regulatory domain-containing protein [Blastocatellia bacterium]|jgi:hypothetical protein|nr:carboxypeptidase-like regulatory domain-containing protein [Blastocatellia bacterium]